jgi:hypothetical protein
MEDKDYRLVLVGRDRIGLIGLKEIFEELKPQRRKPESLLKELLVERTGKKNYVPASSGEEYGRALHREFKKFLGEEVDEERGRFLEVTVLGPGCYSCDKLEQDVMAVLSETGIQASLNHISDPRLIA